MDGGCSEQNLVSEGLSPSEGKEATGPEGSGDEGDVLQSAGLGHISSQDLSDEGSHVRTDTGEVTRTAQVGGQSRGKGILKTAGQ